MQSQNQIEQLIGNWHISEMDGWSAKAFNMEVQAFIKISKNGGGQFQFCLVSGDIDGQFEKRGKGTRFNFSWDGNDECDFANGSGWVKAKGPNQIEGEFKIHRGERSRFMAIKH